MFIYVVCTTLSKMFQREVSSFQTRKERILELNTLTKQNYF